MMNISRVPVTCIHSRFIRCTTCQFTSTCYDLSCLIPYNEYSSFETVTYFGTGSKNKGADSRHAPNLPGIISGKN